MCVTNIPKYKVIIIDAPSVPIRIKELHGVIHYRVNVKRVWIDQRSNKVLSLVFHESKLIIAFASSRSRLWREIGLVVGGDRHVVDAYDIRQIHKAALVEVGGKRLHQHRVRSHEQDVRLTRTVRSHDKVRIGEDMDLISKRAVRVKDSSAHTVPELAIDHLHDLVGVQEASSPRSLHQPQLIDVAPSERADANVGELVVSGAQQVGRHSAADRASVSEVVRSVQQHLVDSDDRSPYDFAEAELSLVLRGQQGLNREAVEHLQAVARSENIAQNTHIVRRPGIVGPVVEGGQPELTDL